MSYARVLINKGNARITIPARIVSELRLLNGDYVQWGCNDPGTALIRPAKIKKINQIKTRKQQSETK